MAGGSGAAGSLPPIGPPVGIGTNNLGTVSSMCNDQVKTLYQWVWWWIVEACRWNVRRNQGWFKHAAFLCEAWNGLSVPFKPGTAGSSVCRCAVYGKPSGQWLVPEPARADGAPEAAEQHQHLPVTAEEPPATAPDRVTHTHPRVDVPDNVSVSIRPLSVSVRVGNTCWARDLQARVDDGILQPVRQLKQCSFLVTYFSKSASSIRGQNKWTQRSRSRNLPSSVKGPAAFSPAEIPDWALGQCLRRPGGIMPTWASAYGTALESVVLSALDGSVSAGSDELSAGHGEEFLSLSLSLSDKFYFPSSPVFVRSSVARLGETSHICYKLSWENSF